MAAIRLYQITLSPFVGGHCRFRPTCSAYALEVFRTQPVHRALWLTLRRLSRCRPLGGGGFDPPPPAHHRRGREGSGA
ncbi:MAG: membrane protein insertion efficiency factor YidD [Planctomycetota bacterium]|nr:MAG: membrane protein insertion efficiency factor YidD [Planctomycetota bacterium]